MRPDRSILRQLLAMDDAQLRLLIGRNAADLLHIYESILQEEHP